MKMSEPKEPRVHTASQIGCLCGTNSLASQWRTSTCNKCENRVDALLKLLMDAAKGQDVSKQAQLLVKKWNIQEKN